MGATQIILLCTIVVLVVMYPILTRIRNKRDLERLQEQTDSLKKGVKVLTTSGVYGTVIEVKQENERTLVVIETGSKDKKGYLTVEAFAIYTVFEEEKISKTKTDEVKPAEIEVEAKKLRQTLEKSEENEPQKKKTLKKTEVVKD